MIEMSATITAGKGSEMHNHDLKYRHILTHCHDSDETTVVELEPYEKTYKEQINEIMKPYIDEYNQKQEERYLAAWNRYNTGKIKTKPRKRDYKPRSYDYYEEHINDTKHNDVTNKDEKIPMFRSLIIGIGDKEDRDKLSEEQAKQIFKNTLRDIKQQFPCFKILGATLHLDEQGFYHMHMDYKPVYEREASKQEKGGGLSVGIGLDGALEKMGFKPEQSIMNSRDKVPLLFNAMRNKMYHILEANMFDYYIRMQYAVSERKDPGKDSSKNQKLEEWQNTQDKVRYLQHQKNMAMDIIENKEIDTDNVVKVIDVLDKACTSLDEVMASPKSRWDKNKILVEYRVLDQMKTFVENLKETFAYLIKKLEDMTQNYYRTKREFEYYKDSIEKKVVMSRWDYSKMEAEHHNQINDNKHLRSKLKNLEEFVLEHSELKIKQIDKIERGLDPNQKEIIHERSFGPRM